MIAYEKLIYTDRIEPKALADIIRTRIEACPGIDLGNYPLGDINVPIKLPHSLRDRHMYIIGRSGYGKTNLIRNMIMLYFPVTVDIMRQVADHSA